MFAFTDLLTRSDALDSLICKDVYIAGCVNDEEEGRRKKEEEKEEENINNHSHNNYNYATSISMRTLTN